MITFVKNPNSSHRVESSPALPCVLESRGVVLDLREGATIFHADQRQDSMYFVKKGVLRSYIRHHNSEITRWFYSIGDLAYSPLTFLYGQPSDFCLEAACSSTVVQVYKEDLLALSHDCPDLKELIDGLQASFLRKEALYNDTAKTLSRFERYEKFIDEFPSVNLQIKVMHLASFLGMTPDTLSRIRREYRDRPSKNNPNDPSNRG